MPSQLVSTRLPMSPNGFGQIQTRRLWQGRLPSSKSNGVHGAWFERCSSARTGNIIAASCRCAAPIWCSR